jgi:hypothetical protein
MQTGLQQKSLLVNTKFANLAGGLLVKSLANGVFTCQKC